jgi:hypothetical protein
MAKGKRFGRVARLIGACAVAGAIIAGPMAGAGQAADLSSFAGQGTGFALRVVVDLTGLPAPIKSAIDTAYGTLRSALPSTTAAQLPASFPFLIDQRFLQTLSQLGQVTQAHALLGQGTLQDILGAPFNKSADATKVGQHSTASASPAAIPGAGALPNLNLLGIGVGQLSASIPTATQVLSNGTLVSVTASLQSLLSALNLPTDILNQLTAGLNGLTSQIQGVINTANSSTGVLGGALSTVGNTLASTPVDSTLGGILGTAGLGNAIGNPTQMVSQLQNLVKIPDIGNLLNGTLASINGLVNNASAQKVTGKSFSDATSSLASIDVLGLLHVGAVNLASHSEAGGVPGTAKNTSSCSLLTARLGAAGVSTDGKSIVVNGVPVPVPAVDLSTVQNAVNTVLNAAGLSVSLCDTAQGHTAADGTSASQTVSALRIQFAPTILGAIEGASDFTPGSTPIKIIIDPSVETAASAGVAAASVSHPVLPHTGAAPLATIVTGLIVTGGALVLRRRFAA